MYLLLLWPWELELEPLVMGAVWDWQPPLVLNRVLVAVAVAVQHPRLGLIRALLQVMDC